MYYMSLCNQFTGGGETDHPYHENWEGGTEKDGKKGWDWDKKGDAH